MQRVQRDSWLGDVTLYLWEEGIRSVHSSVSGLKQIIIGPGNRFIQGRGHKFQGETLTLHGSCMLRCSGHAINAMTPLNLRPRCFFCTDLHWPLVLTISATAGKLLWMIPLEVRCGCLQSSQIAPAWHLLLRVSGVCLKASHLTMSKSEKWPCVCLIGFSKSNGQNFHLERRSTQD